MRNVREDLTAALKERIAIISDEESRHHPETHMGRLRAISERIDDLYARLPRPIEARLAHYLDRRSYDKALECLERDATPAADRAD